MDKYRLELKLKSDTLIGSGEGWGGVVDSDVIFDRYGIPYIPARRLKGCLREAALELTEAFVCSGINDIASVDDIFGSFVDKENQGDKVTESVFNISNAYIKDYDQVKPWLEYLYKAHSGICSKETMLQSFTALRHQTKIAENGTAENHSLRTSRVLRKDITFYSDISINDKLEKAEKILALSAAILRRMGTMRNRGFGEVECRLLDSDKVDITKVLIEKIKGERL